MTLVLQLLSTGENRHIGEVKYELYRFASSKPVCMSCISSCGSPGTRSYSLPLRRCNTLKSEVACPSFFKSSIDLHRHVCMLEVPVIGNQKADRCAIRGPVPNRFGSRANTQYGSEATQFSQYLVSPVLQPRLLVHFPNDSIHRQGLIHLSPTHSYRWYWNEPILSLGVPPGCPILGKVL